MDTDDIVIENIADTRDRRSPAELVERKGIGHPDSLADGVAEAVSRKLCRRYREEFGHIAHHNTDEVQIIGGKSSPAFGGGTMEEPIYILLGGRATRQYDGVEIDVDRVAQEAAREYLRQTVRHLDVDDHVEIDVRIGAGSSDLTAMYSRSGAVPLANDTSFGIGHAPLSDLENAVLKVEKQLNTEPFMHDHPFLGEDVKVMGSRVDDTMHFTVAAAVVDRYVENMADYRDKKQTLRDAVRDIVTDHVNQNVEVAINTADGDAEEELYLTVTGTSAEMGDDGSTGRGNRVSGLITPKRSMSLEASSGKNPVAHVGKIYNLMAHLIAEQIVDEVGSVEEAHVKLLSQIGRPINEPQVAGVRIVTDDGGTVDRTDISSIVNSHVENPERITEMVLDGDIDTF